MPEILQFKKSNSLRVEAKAGSSSADLVIYGPVGEVMWGDEVSAKMVSDELKKLPDSVKEINVRLNSPGGDCFMGIAIYNRLKQHPAKIKCYVDGLSASIASIIMLAADEVIIGEGALVMIHLPWSVSMGNRNDLENTISRLMDVEEQMISIYSKRMKMSRAEIRALLEKETWMDAQEAVDVGLATSMMAEKAKIAASSLKASWIHKKPENVKTVEAAKILDFKNKVEDFLARSKK